MTEQALVYHQEPGCAPLKMWTRGVPVEEAAMPHGHIVSVPMLGGLHHQYVRIA